MHALRVAPLPQGDAVLLADAAQTTLLPIFVGGTEALSIQLRLAHEPYERPLTHDLVDSLVRELGATITKVQVDELRDGTFIGSIWLRHDDRLVQIDARPSDAIAMALGAAVPIYVARAVLAAAGLSLSAPPAGSAPAPPPPPRTF
jgi:bifunctional DNase/RNase